MKNGLLTAGILMTGLVVFAGTLTVAGAALRQPPADVVLAVRPSEIETQPKGQILFPHTPEKTLLTVEQIAVYEGPLIEKGSDEPIVDALALILHNGAEEEILSVQVMLESTEAAYCFEGSHIPGQSRVLLVEKDGAQWEKTEYIACTAKVEYAEDPGLLETVAVVETGMGKLSITNLTEKRLRDVWICHKNCLSDGDIYVGGITYRTSVGDLEPGQTVETVPERYAKGYSKVVRVEGITEE